MIGYSIDLTIAPEITHCDRKMRPFLKSSTLGKCAHPVLRIDVEIKHVDLVFYNTPACRKTWVDHQEGKVYVSLPQDISGYHAKAILLGERGISLLSRIALEADTSGQQVCVSSPSNYYGYLIDLWSCLNDHLETEYTVEASELLLKELRVKLSTKSGKAISRLESLAKNKEAVNLYDPDLEHYIDTEEALNESIKYRIKKAAVKGVNLVGIEERMMDLYRFCIGEKFELTINRKIKRAMPLARTYRTFGQALSDAVESFQIAEDQGLVLDEAVEIVTEDTSDEAPQDIQGSLFANSEPANERLATRSINRSVQAARQSLKTKKAFAKTAIKKSIGHAGNSLWDYTVQACKESGTVDQDSGAGGGKVVSMASYATGIRRNTKSEIGHNSYYRQIRIG